MKKFLKAQIKHEILGQAILDLITQKIPISEKALLTQLKSALEITLSHERKEGLLELIYELSIRAKSKSTSSGSLVERAMSRNDEQEHSDAEFIILTQDNKHKLH